MKAIQRKDLLDDGYKIPTGQDTYIEVREAMTSLQPDEMDNAEFNVILLDEAGEFYATVMSIDMEFVNA